MFSRDAFLLGANSWNYLNSEDAELRDFGSFMYLTNRSESTIDLWHSSYEAKSWLGDIELPVVSDNPSMKRRSDPLALFIQNFRSEDTSNDIETGQQKWLLLSGSERFALLINNKTYSCERDQDAAWHIHMANIESWDLSYQEQFLGPLTSIHLGSSSDESDDLKYVSDSFGLALIVDDPDFEQEISVAGALDDYVYGGNYNWQTSYGARLYCHFSNPDYLFGGAISPNPSSEFRRLEVFFKVLDDLGFRGLAEIGPTEYLIGDSIDADDWDIQLKAPFFDLSGNLVWETDCWLQDIERAEEVSELAAEFHLKIDVKPIS